MSLIFYIVKYISVDPRNRIDCDKNWYFLKHG